MVSLVSLVLEEVQGRQVHQEQRVHVGQTGTKASKGGLVFRARGVGLDYQERLDNQERRA